MGLAHMIDASNPPNTMPTGFQAVAGYIGGNTPHVWTLAEWLRFKDHYQLPIWTGFLEHDPVARAREAAMAAARLGWKAFHKPVRWIINDGETSTDAKWFEAFAGEVAHQGFQAVPYGSLSAVLQVTRGEVWAAQWGAAVPLPAIAPGRVPMIQYAPGTRFGGTRVDLSVVDTDVLQHFGRGPRR